MLENSQTTSSAVTALTAHWREYLIEAALLAMFMVSASTFAIALEHPFSPFHPLLHSPLIRRAITGVAMGVTAVLLIYSNWGKRSGAHMNPAVTLCFLRLGRIDRRDAAFYILAQFIGGAFGVLLARAVAPMLITHPSINCVATIPGENGIGAAWVAEFVISLLMMGMILGVNRVPWMLQRTGYFAGALVALYITFEAPLSGMSINPARTLGSALVGNVFTGIWIYFTAPVAGMLTAVELHRSLSRHPHLLCGKLTHDRNSSCIFKCNCLDASGIEAR